MSQVFGGEAVASCPEFLLQPVYLHFYLYLLRSCEEIMRWAMLLMLTDKV